MVGGHDIQSMCDSALLECFSANSCATIIICGDLFNRANMPTDALMRFQRFIHTKLAGFHCKVYVISGNHELTPDGNSSLELIEWPHDWLLVHRDVYLTEFNGVKIALAPYLHHGYSDMIASIPSDYVVFSHVLVDTATGRIQLSSDVKPKLFERFPYVFLGDVHKMQRVGRNIMYTGCFVQTSYNDYGYTFGYLTVELSRLFKHKALTFCHLKTVAPLPERVGGSVGVDDQERMQSIFNIDVPATASLTMDEALAFVEQHINKCADAVTYMKELRSTINNA